MIPATGRLTRSPWLRPALAALCLSAAWFPFAFVAAPASCTWGLGAYWWGGMMFVAVLALLPVIWRNAATGWHRAGFALLFAGAGCGVWIAGLFAANVRIICKLF